MLSLVVRKKTLGFKRLRKRVKKKHLIQTQFAPVPPIKALTSALERGNELPCPMKCERD
jgi:hypothetical protein